MTTEYSFRQTFVVPVFASKDVVIFTAFQFVRRRAACGSVRAYRCALGLSVLASFGTIVSAASAQDGAPSAGEYTIKAAYIYNFLRYIEWPDRAFDDAKSPFVVGVLGEVPADLQKAFAFYAQEKTVRGRPIKVRHFKAVDDIDTCHIVFLTKQPGNDLQQQAVDRLAKVPTLLVGESNGFLQQGGEISFFFAANKVRIRMALKETRRKGLKPSAKLLQVAQLVD